jgi:hypothetical protein
MCKDSGVEHQYEDSVIFDGTGLFKHSMKEASGIELVVNNSP